MPPNNFKKTSRMMLAMEIALYFFIVLVLIMAFLV
jgi:hypothetical protein